MSFQGIKIYITAPIQSLKQTNVLHMKLYKCSNVQVNVCYKRYLEFLENLNLFLASLLTLPLLMWSNRICNIYVWSSSLEVWNNFMCQLRIIKTILPVFIGQCSCQMTYTLTMHLTLRCSGYSYKLACVLVMVLLTYLLGWNLGL